MDTSTILEVAAIIGGAITLVFATASGYFAWKNGAPQISSDVISTYKARVEQLESRVSTCEGLHRENLGEIGKLKGIIEEKDKRIVILENVKIDQNPEMMAFMKLVTQTSLNADKYMSEARGILIGVKDFFDHLQNGKYTIVSSPSAA